MPYPQYQWFSTWVPRHPRVPKNTLGVPQISKIIVVLLINNSQGCRQNVVLEKGRVPRVEKG
jgi:hypothetical protein